MKKFTSTLFLAFIFVFSLSTNTIADEGQIPIGGRNCPPNTTCLTDGQIPIGGKTVNTQLPTQEDEPTILKTVIDYLAQFLG